jgi:hypothetical protein
MDYGRKVERGFARKNSLAKHTAPPCKLHTETFEKRPFLSNPPEADKFLHLPCEMRSLFLWGHAQISILKILDVFLRLKF